jgi:Cdc6-like AAA superfamily ATPase
MEIKKYPHLSKFEEKLNHKHHLHPKIIKLTSKFPVNLKDLSHLIIYGAPGTGKYTVALKIIRRYSPTKLKYDKKITISSNKNPYFVKMSDIHYEIDMATLGCNSKTLWHDIFIQLVDTVSLKKTKVVIFLCKYFHEINIELLDIFYSYMHDLNNKLCFGVEIKYIILTEHLSFIPDSISKCCLPISVPKHTIARYAKTLEIKLENITNNLYDVEAIVPYEYICDNIVIFLKSEEAVKLLKLRDLIYDILIYNLNIHDACWYILEKIDLLILKTKRHLAIKSLYQFFHFYNNNYRPIYHFEMLFISLYKLIHELST